MGVRFVSREASWRFSLLTSIIILFNFSTNVLIVYTCRKRTFATRVFPAPSLQFRNMLLFYSDVAPRSTLKLGDRLLYALQFYTA